MKINDSVLLKFGRAFQAELDIQESRIAEALQWAKNLGIPYTTSINIGEIYYGACRTQRRDQIIKAFEAHVFTNITILPFDKKSGVAFARLKAALEKQSIRCSESDLRIAAIAIQHDLILITGNVKHFVDIPGLSIENWI